MTTKDTDVYQKGGHPLWGVKLLATFGRQGLIGQLRSESDPEVFERDLSPSSFIAWHVLTAVRTQGLAGGSLNGDGHSTISFMAKSENFD